MTNEKDLLEFLAGLGFEGPQIEAGLQRLYGSGAVTGTIPYLRMYGAEQMRYALQFEYDRQFQSYRLTGYIATHREPVTIEHKVIGGIDTSILEQRMQREDWQDYFGEQKGYQHNPDKDFIRDTINSLNSLSTGQNFDGKKIQEELRFKYWPLDSYEDEGKEDLIHLYECSREFTARSHGISNARLAYHIVSGSLDRLHEQLLLTDLQEYPGIALYDLLCAFLSTDVDRFDIQCSAREAEGEINYCIPVTWDGAGFIAGLNKVTFIPNVDIPHGVFRGIDSAQLEARMQEINWDTDHLYRMEGDNPVLLPPASDIKDRLDLISETTDGRAVADMLRMRYWSGAPLLETFVTPGIKGGPVMRQHFTLDTPARAIFNLMCGRAVIGQSLRTLPADYAQWLRLYKASKISGELHRLEPIDGLSRKEINELLGMLPLQDKSPALANALLLGDRVAVTVKTLSGVQQILVEADPEHKTLALFTGEGQSIPFNFHLKTSAGLQRKEHQEMNAFKSHRQGNRHKGIR